MSDFTVNK